MSQSEVQQKGAAAKAAAAKLALAPSALKNRVLDLIAAELLARATQIIAANQLDLQAGRAKGLSSALLDRLMLNQERIAGMVEGLKVVKKLSDPIGQTIARWRRPNGLRIKKVRVPLGVIGIIYEARPNVTIDSAALCLKTGNAVVLRGGSDAINSNRALAQAIGQALLAADLPAGAVGLIESTDRESATELMQAREFIDVLIPRGGKNLIQTVVQNSTVPVIETGEGNCHAYVETSANLKMAEEIVYNAKVSRPSVCNAIETLLVDEAVAARFLPALAARLTAAKVELRGCAKTVAILPGIKLASEEDWGTEFLSLVLAVKVVAGLDEAIAHINRYNTKHSETIITKNRQAAERFQREVDAAAVYHNASTRFTDGFEFGFGAEIGISTQKLHARGPMGLAELTSYKYLIDGSGQIR